MVKENGCDEKDHKPRMMWTKINKFLEIFHETERTKNKMLKVDPDLQRYREDAYSIL